jgi:polysaccharide export outer membrane protein
MRWKLVLAIAGWIPLAGHFGRADEASRIPPPEINEYRLGPGDVIEVFVWKEADLTATAVVRPDGKISIPLINEVEASGKTAAELQEEISQRLRRFLTEPVVSVILKEVNAPKVSVLGNVRKPDLYKITHKLTVLDAVALAGGFNEYARRDKVIVIRNSATGAQKFKVNLERFIEKDAVEVFYLQQHDTVYVQ